MLRIKKLLIDYLEQPMGVETMPAFCWIMESDAQNVRQSAYRLQIARDAGFENVIYDSGRVASGESAHVTVDGVALDACTRYYVRARAWSDGDASDWSATAQFLTGMVGGGWTARFITAEGNGDWRNSKGTYVRRAWTAEKPVRSAVVCATALGLYHLYINGKPVGDEKMLPGWTSYRSHLCYQTWDVTKMIRPGENVIGASLGAGWYKGMMGFIHERCAYGDRTALLAQLVLRYDDGTEETIITDENWLGCASPVTFSEIYDGERLDARLDQPGWNAPGFAPRTGDRLPEKPEEAYRRPEAILSRKQKEANRVFAQDYRHADTLWRPVRTTAFPMDALTPQPGCRPRIHETFPVKEVIVTPEGDTVLDFGQNLTGYVRFRVDGRPGELAHLRCFETLDAKGNAYFDNLRGALAEIRYICAGGEVEYDEQFSFQGFRYALVAAWPGEVRPEDFTACTVYSDMPETGRFRCSNPLINQLQHNIGWSLRDNFLDIPTDCPQRDERMGWTGDAQIFCRTAAFLRGCYPFFSKWLKDVSADQNDEGGVPHMVPDTLQYFKTNDWLVQQGAHSAAGWADVAVILPWTLYQVYGDVRILEAQFDSMKGWIDFMRAHSEDFLWSYRLQFGDWVALDAEEGSYFGATPAELTNTAYYAYVTGLFAQTCRALGRADEAREYAALHECIVDKFRRLFLDERGVMTVQTQTAHVLALYFGLVPPQGVRGTAEGLRRLIEKEGGHLVTGFMGTPYICFALSQNGCAKEAYDLLMKEDFPSWLYQVKAGATTIWEHWDGMKPDGSMWSPDMNSFNHYAYGAVGDWLYRVVAGIDTDPDAPGYRRAMIAPLTGGGLTWAEGSLDTLYGKLAASWRRDADAVTLEVVVPVNASAVITLEPGAKAPQGALSFAESADARLRAEVGSGRWTVRYRVEA